MQDAEFCTKVSSVVLAMMRTESGGWMSPPESGDAQARPAHDRDGMETHRSKEPARRRMPRHAKERWARRAPLLGCVAPEARLVPRFRSS
jgi:hypothetical protein